MSKYVTSLLHYDIARKHENSGNTRRGAKQSSPFSPRSQRITTTPLRAGPYDGDLRNMLTPHSPSYARTLVFGKSHNADTKAGFNANIVFGNIKWNGEARNGPPLDYEMSMSEKAMIFKMRQRYNGSSLENGWNRY